MAAKRIVKFIGISIGVGVAGYLVVALGLVLSQGVELAGAQEETIELDSAMEADYADIPPLLKFEARDRTRLSYRHYEAPGARRILVLVHGSAWHGMQFHTLAQALAERGLAEVVVPNMRGHGVDPVRRGDVDYIGQMEDDVADLIAHVETKTGIERIVLGGHSSGGGFVVRFAGGPHGAMADALVLMAPFLKYNAPTTRANSGGWARPATRRIIGLTMLNAVGITALNHLPVLSFAMPQSVLEGPLGDTVTTTYSYRLNTGFAPRLDYHEDLAALDRPFLLIAGTADEAFHTDRYEDVISAETSAGRYVLLDGVTHIGLVSDPAMIEAVAGFLSEQSGN